MSQNQRPTFPYLTKNTAATCLTKIIPVYEDSKKDQLVSIVQNN